ncbi:MAG: hypothetical protein EVJ46_07375 [Candidatus Acididesulfobacter guangdongensis]|uniref:Uncharacterized protein n=1 Tax=Acididesulfobacter guangdongensis TaxID=2597225 RepID=A0A519BFH2_ACIG2|nr:MAG: hypothetical protein EVJ46_07375 [Candidatus Acididesulfobacter guangdongensis]
MKENNNMPEISDEDIKAAFKEVNTYVDISIEDFKEIYLHALRHAKNRLLNISIDSVMTKDIISVTEDRRYFCNFLPLGKIFYSHF